MLASVFNNILAITHFPGIFDYLSTTTYSPPLEESGQGATGRESHNSVSLFCSLRPTGESTEPIPHSPIHTLNDDVLLNIFHLYRVDVQHEYTYDGLPDFYLTGQSWWYKLTQVCGRWRYLIFASPSQLRLHLLCTYGVSVAKMLAHSPPLPLTIYYDGENRETTEEDEENILLALRHSDRVHYISLDLPPPKMRKIITTMDEQFPILERLYILSQTRGDGSLVLPRTFQAPLLRHFLLGGAALPIGSSLLTTTAGLVSLRLTNIPPSAYFPPTYLVTQLLLLPQLEILKIDFHSPLPNRDVERQLLATPIMPHVTLPNLRVFVVKGVSAYLEGLLRHISTPVLTRLYITFFNQLSFTVPRLLQFLATSETLSCNTVRLTFHNDSAQFMAFQPREDHSFWVNITCRHLDWQVSSAAQILNTLQPVLSVVEKLTLLHVQPDLSSEWHNEVDRVLWRQLLRPFTNLETLRVHNKLIENLAHSLQTEDGEPQLELLPNLKEVEYSGEVDVRDAFIPFIDERQVAGHPVNLTVDNDHSDIYI